MSIDDSPPRWTPPMPPVAKTSMPARCAAIIVAETVVPPQPGRASTPARFCRETLGMSRASASSTSCSSVRPTSSRPSRTATVAGTAPDSRTAASAHAGGLEVVGAWQPVGGDGRLEGHHGTTVGERVGGPREDRRAGRWGSRLASLAELDLGPAAAQGSGGGLVAGHGRTPQGLVSTQPAGLFTRAQQRTQEARREGVAGAGGVDLAADARGGHVDWRMASPSSRSTRQPQTPSLTTTSAGVAQESRPGTDGRSRAGALRLRPDWRRGCPAPARPMRARDRRTP